MFLLALVRRAQITSCGAIATSPPSLVTGVPKELFDPTIEVERDPSGLTRVAGDDRTWVKEVIAKVNAGDIEAFQEIVLRYEALIYGMIRRQIGGRDVVEELAQDVFVRAFRHLDSFRYDARFSTWLTRIALNVVKNHLASRRHREGARTFPFCLKQLCGLGAQRSTFDPDRESADTVRAAVAELPEKYREVVALCGFEEMTYVEAADVLGVPVGTVCSRMNVALTKLRRALKGESL